MAIVFLALGSNVGDSRAFIDKAVNLIGKSVTNISRAPIYTSKAVGYTDQPDFLNTAIKGETELVPDILLSFIKDIEKQVGRVQRFRWGPREIDIDIIFYDDEIVDKPSLQIPHPRFAERDFVLRPACDLSPKFVDPVSKLTVTELYEKLPKSSVSIFKE